MRANSARAHGICTAAPTEGSPRQDEPKGELYGFSWGAMGARLLQRMNAHALLLTPPMLAASMATPGIRRDELPYTRTVQWPACGLHFREPTLRPRDIDVPS